MKGRLGILFVGILVLLLNAYVQAQTFSAISGHGLPALNNTIVQWADFNADGFADVAIAGEQSDGTPVFRIYLNNGDETFSELSTSIPQRSTSDFIITDINNDNYPDLVISSRVSPSEGETLIYTNNGNETFSVFTHSIAGLRFGSLAEGDVNADGRRDIMISGFDNSNVRRTYLYYNTPIGFEPSPYNFTGLNIGAVLIEDLNNDGLKDIIISGRNSANNRMLQLLKNIDGYQFEVQSLTSFNNFQASRIVAADLNGNGYKDLVIQGNDGDVGNFTDIFFNSTVFNFQRNTSYLANLTLGGIAVGDVDNDGDADIVINGSNSSSFRETILYLNDGSGVFSLESDDFSGLVNGSAHLMDINNNDRLELILLGRETDGSTGMISKIYESDVVATNSSPSAPSNPEVTVDYNQVIFSWDAATDTETASGSLEYNLYIGSTSGGTDIFSPLSEIGGNSRFTFSNGNVGHALSYRLDSIPEGSYHWSVQAIDAGKKASVFASEEPLIVCDAIQIEENDLEICTGDEVVLEVGTIDDVVKWYSLEDGHLFDGQQFNYTVLKTDTLIAEVLKPLGCTVYDTLVIKALELPVKQLPVNLDICIGEVIDLEIDNTFTVEWSSDKKGSLGTDNAIAFEVLEDDEITAIITNASGCFFEDILSITALNIPNSNAALDTAICYQEYFVFELEETWEQIRWISAKEGVILENEYLLERLITEADTIFIEKENNLGCINYDTLLIGLNPLPEPNLGADRVICFGDELQLEITEVVDEINWYSVKSGHLGVGTIFNWSPQETDTLVVSLTDFQGCIGYDSLTVTVFELPQFLIGNDTTLCTASVLELNVGTGWDEVNWYTKKQGLIAADTWFISYEAMESDTLWVEVRDMNACVNYDSIAVGVYPIPEISLGEDITICFGEEISIEANPTYDSINWYSQNTGFLGSGNAVLTFTAQESDLLWTEIFTANHCSNSDSIAINVLALPVFDLGDELTLCEGDEVILNMGISVEGFQSVEWYSERLGLIESATNEITIIAQESDSIWVEATDENGCYYSDSIELTVNPLPRFSLGGDRSICYGESLRLSIETAFESVHWYSSVTDLSNLTSADYEAVYTESMEVWVVIQDEKGCVFSDTISIEVIPLPQFGAGADRIICENESTALGSTAVEGYSYSWEPAELLSDAHAAEPIALPTETTRFYVTYKDSNGCVNTDSVLVEVDPQTVLDAGSDVEICYGGQVQLGGAPTASGSSFGYEYAWFPSEGLSDPTAANPTVSPEESTTYYVVVATGTCRIDTAEVRVTVNPLPEIELTADTTIGAGSSVRLEAFGGVIYRWSPSNFLTDPFVNRPIASPPVTTTYTVEVTDENGCVNEKEVTVFVENQLFIPSLFTPNNDGQNDYFRVYGSGIRDLLFEVYDRSGSLLYRTSSVEEALSTGWDGTFNGRPMENGVYVWALKGSYFDGSPLRFEGKNNGFIKLVR